jgi:hypothetical protein
MHAITFEADIVGEFLRIPSFERFQNKHVRVVIEDTFQPKATSDIDDCFDQFNINLANYHFNRDEANER